MRITTALIFAWRKSRGGIGEDADQGGAIHLLVRDGGRKKIRWMHYVACMHGKTEGRGGTHGCSISHQISNVRLMERLRKRLNGCQGIKI
jgi:hypothetical protein